MRAIMLSLLLSVPVFGQTFSFIKDESAPERNHPSYVPIVEPVEDTPVQSPPLEEASALAARANALIRRVKELQQPSKPEYVLTKCLNVYPAPRHFDLGGYAMTKENLIAHLMGEIGAIVHEGKFRRKTLVGLTLTQLRNLHSNDHGGTPFIWEYRQVGNLGVRMPGTVRTAKKSQPLSSWRALPQFSGYESVGVFCPA